MDPQTFGRYNIVRKLAGGGMGRVFLVWDTDQKRNVGLKLIDTGHDRESLDVVEAERSGANLQDQLAKREPGGRVADIYDVGERDGYFFIAMEYVEGEDLSELVSRGPLPPERAVRIAIDLLDVLSRAHNFETVIDGRSHRGIIHGDIKPRNIRITPGGQIKVLDFGIAKAVSMTRSITFNQYGSVPYSSPERIRTGDVDARSDVWSVAVVLFEMLAGHAYFTADTSARLEVKIRDYAARSRDLTQLPDGLRDILSRALDPDVARRFPSAAAFEQALEEWCAGGKAALLAQDPDATRRTLALPEEATTRRATYGPFLNSDLRSPAQAPRTAWLPAAGKTALLAVSVLSLMVGTGILNQPNLNQAKKPEVALPAAAPADVAPAGAPAPATAAPEAQPKKPTPLAPASEPPAARDPEPTPAATAPTQHAPAPLRDRTADAERIIAGYRQSGKPGADWKTARLAIAASLKRTPNDTTLRAESLIIDGHLKLDAHNVKAAQTAFGEAGMLLPKSPDPPLGLGFAYIAAGNLVQAEDALNAAKENGFEPGPREQTALADGYRLRGEHNLSIGRSAHEFRAMEASLQRAEADLGRAHDLYLTLRNQQQATRVYAERQHAIAVLAQARRIRPRAPVTVRKVPPKPQLQTQTRRNRLTASRGSP
jgi:serine/threonine-protein kinase